MRFCVLAGPPIGQSASVEIGGPDVISLFSSPVMRYENDPSIHEVDGEFYHRPSGFWVKLIYLLAGLAVLGAGISFLWEPAGRIFFGNQAEGRIVRIEVDVPGGENRVYRYRREYEEERDRAITFRHYVSVPWEGRDRVMRLGVDSRVEPYANVNDLIDVSFYDEDEYAYATWHARSWGIGALYTVVGLCFVGTGIPMLLAVGRPIKLDPEAPPEDASPDKYGDASPDHPDPEEPAHEESEGPKRSS